MEYSHIFDDQTNTLPVIYDTLKNSLVGSADDLRETLLMSFGQLGGVVQGMLYVADIHTRCGMCEKCVCKCDNIMCLCARCSGLCAFVSIYMRDNITQSWVIPTYHPKYSCPLHKQVKRK